MDEATWLSATDPRRMLAFLRENCKVSDRKLRLFACACVRRIWPLLTDADGRTALEVAEQFADGVGGKEELQAARRAAPRRPAGALARPRARQVGPACSALGPGGVRIGG